MTSSVQVAIRLEQKVRILAWFDHANLIASRRPGVDLLGTVERVQEVAGDVTVWVRVDGVDGIFTFKLSDLEADGLSPRPDPPVTLASRSGDSPAATSRAGGTAGFLGEATERKQECRRSTR